MFNNGIPANVTKADYLFYRNLKQILGSGHSDAGQSVRPRWADGKPAHTIYLLNTQETYDLSRGEIPITTLRPIAWRSGIGEVLWIYRDASNNLDLLKNRYGVTWWDKWDIGDRTIGACYGEVVRRYDLFNKLMAELNRNPFGRRHIMNLWQEKELSEPHGLDPCCFMTTWNVTVEDSRPKLHMKLEQRSSDYIMAGHINKMQYVSLQQLVARELGFALGTFTHSVTNLHIYDRHIAAAQELIRRYETEVCQRPVRPEIKLDLVGGVSLQDLMPSDFSLSSYQPLPKLDQLEIAI